MNEKIVITLSIAGFLGIMLISSKNQVENLTSNINENVPQVYIEDIHTNYIDDVFPETTYVEDGNAMPQSNNSALSSCSVKSMETDDFIFANAFKYYRQCLGSDSSFQWNGKTYSTLLIEEVIIEMADSTEEKSTSDKIHEVSEIH